MSENKITFGLDRVHIAFYDDTTPPDNPVWEKPIHIRGAVRWTPSTVGDSTPFYADNTTYYVVTSNNGYTGELEMALLPDEIKARINGWIIDDNGALVEVSDGKPEKFALLGQVQGDKRNRRFVYYDCSASRTAKEEATKGESVEPTTEVMNVNVSPIVIDDRQVVKTDLEQSSTNTAAFNGFFDEVYLPTITIPTP